MKKSTSIVVVMAISLVTAGALTEPVAAPARGSAVILRDFAANWIIMTDRNDSENTPVLRLRLVKNHIVGTGAGGRGKIDLWRLNGRKLKGFILLNKTRIPLSVELNSDKGQLIIIDAPPQSEYDVALAWREGYKPAM